MGSSAWMLPAKVAAASTAVAAAAVVLLMLAPPAAGFLATEVPRVYVSLLRWLSPPYLYFVINGIIISIAVSSRFQKATDDDPAAAPVSIPSRPAEVATPVELRPELAPPPSVTAEAPGTKNDEEEEFVLSRSNWEPRRRVLETASEQERIERSPSTVSAAATAGEDRPLVLERFGHRRSVKPSPEGKTLGVARSKRHETLENTWRTITDGRAVPLARHLKKSDTWDAHHDDATATATASPPQPMRKSETFTAARSGSGSRLRREPSVGQDDLNRRVEAFIKKFNEEMRLQRQESLQQYLDMINRGAE